VLVDAAAALSASWQRRRPAQRDDLAIGAPALALALADGLARRFGGLVALGTDQPEPPAAAEPTRAVLLTKWPEGGAACAALASMLPGLELTEDPVRDEPWVAEEPGGYGLWLSTREVGVPGAGAWLREADPQAAPLQAGPDHSWVLRIEGPEDVQTPAVAAVLDGAVVALAHAMAGRAVDDDGFPILAAD
jgi:hypothetical protein